jgi:hypothetical protein
VRRLLDCGKSWISHKDGIAHMRVRRPSRMKLTGQWCTYIQAQPSLWPTPAMCLIPNASNPPKAPNNWSGTSNRIEFRRTRSPASVDPAKNIDTRRLSSVRVYHVVNRTFKPGNNPAFCECNLSSHTYAADEPPYLKHSQEPSRCVEAFIIGH